MIDERDDGKTGGFTKNVLILGPSMFNAFLIVFWGSLFKQIAFFVTRQENYQYEKDHS